MAYFQKAFPGFNLYTGQQLPGDRGFIGFVIPGNNIDASSIELSDALKNTSNYYGVFVFSAIVPVITADNVDAFIKAILNVANDSFLSGLMTQPTLCPPHAALFK